MKEKKSICGFRWTVVRLFLVISLCSAAVEPTFFPDRSSAKAEVVAEIEGEAITAAELEKPLLPFIYQLERQIFQVKSQRLEGIITERLLTKEAARRGLSVKELVETEINAKASEVSTAEMEEFFRRNRILPPENGRGSRGISPWSEEEVKKRLRREQFFNLLKAQARVSVHLKEPLPPKITVETAVSPSRGPEGAVVTIVEFSDYQ